MRVRKEVRFAVVLYGGASLAIYINGVVQEMFHLVRATAPDPDDPSHALAGIGVAHARETWAALATWLRARF